MILALISVLSLLALSSWVKSLPSPGLILPMVACFKITTFIYSLPIHKLSLPWEVEFISSPPCIWTGLLFLWQIETAILCSFQRQVTGKLLASIWVSWNAHSGGSSHLARWDHHALRKSNLVIWRSQVKREIPNQPFALLAIPVQARDMKMKKFPNDSGYAIWMQLYERFQKRILSWH